MDIGGGFVVLVGTVFLILGLSGYIGLYWMDQILKLQDEEEDKETGLKDSFESGGGELDAEE